MTPSLDAADGMSPAARRLYDAMHQSCAVGELPDRTQLVLTGRDRQRFLHNLCTHDVAKLVAGRGCEAFATNVQGKCVGHLQIACRPDSLLVSTVPGQAELLMNHWDRYLITEDVQMEDRSGECSELLLAGPACDTIMSQIAGTIPTQNLYDNSDLSLDGATCLATRVPMFAVETVSLSVPRTKTADIVALLAQAGAVTETAEATQAAFEAARIEHAFPWFGRDITDKNLPQEVQRDALAISFHKGCYLGQETIARLDALGHVNRVLTRLRCELATPPADGTPLVLAGKAVGEITSAAYSPRFQLVALAYVRCDAAQRGTQLELPEGVAIVLGIESAAP